MINDFDGALAKIISLLASSEHVADSVLPCVAQIVERCTTTDAASWRLVQIGAIPAIVDAMRANVDNRPFQSAACRALAKLATSSRAVAALCSQDGVAAVVATLKRDCAHHDVALAAVDFINALAAVRVVLLCFAFFLCTFF